MFGLSRRHYRTIPYRMFDNLHYGLEAKNARILERVYHKGHAHAWDGKEVLQSLIDEHGSPRLDAETKNALGRVFSIIMWVAVCQRFGKGGGFVVGVILLGWVFIPILGFGSAQYMPAEAAAPPLPQERQYGDPPA